MSSALLRVRRWTAAEKASSLSPSGDKSTGYFVQPTVFLTEDPKSYTMQKEIFGAPCLSSFAPSCTNSLCLPLCAGPVVTIFVYEDDQWEQTCELIDNTSEYALTGSIFSYDRQALSVATDLLRNSAGNLYLNEEVRELRRFSFFCLAFG